MWFKNLRLCCLTQHFDLSVEEFESQLAGYAFAPCSNYEKSRVGWVSPLGNAAVVGEGEREREGNEEGDGVAPTLTHSVGDYIMLCARTQDRLLPASVVREATLEKIAAIEVRQARKVYRKEKREIQDNVFASLLPRAFTRSSRTFAYISRAEKLLVIDNANAPKEEEILNFLRDTRGSFPIALANRKRARRDVMTRRVNEGKEEGRCGERDGGKDRM